MVNLIIPTGEFENESKDSLVQRLLQLNQQIVERIQIMVHYAEQRGCPQMRCKLHHFKGRMREHSAGNEGEYAFLDDRMIQSLAIGGEQHLSPNNTILRDLFDRRAELMAQLG